MSTFLSSLLVALSLSIAALLASIAYRRVKQSSLRRIPGPPNVSFWKGNYGQIFHAGARPFHEHIIKTYGNIIRINAALGETQLLISDPKACNSILLKDQEIFEEAPWFLESNRHVFGSSLLATMGPHHRKQRKMLNPAFSIKHMRSMTPLFQKITSQLEDVIRTKSAEGAQEIDMLDWLGRLALELIAQGGLGYSFGSLQGEENDFARALKEYFPTMSTMFFWRSKFPLVSKLPAKLLRFVAACLPWPALHRIMDIVDVLHVNSKKVFDEKRALLAKGDADTVHQIDEGKDIISILLKSNESASAEDRLPDEEILAQLTTFLFVGSDTTSNALSRTLYLLSQDQRVQEKLREELVEAYKNAGDAGLGYDALISLPYMEAVCRETLRVYPPVSFASRMCRKDMTIPLSEPIHANGGDMHSLYVPNGTEVFVNILGINCSTSIWGADAAEWKPERWLAPLPATVEDARIPGIYSNTLTFLGGSRACIGFKFSQLEMKVALAQLIRSFHFSPAKDQVVWRFGMITTPCVEGSTGLGPKMPMLVERV